MLKLTMTNKIISIKKTSKIRQNHLSLNIEPIIYVELLDFQRFVQRNLKDKICLETEILKTFY